MKWFKRKASICIRQGTFLTADETMNGYTHAEVCALIAPLFNREPDDECTLGIALISHKKDGTHLLEFVSDAPADVAATIFMRVAFEAQKQAGLEFGT